MNMGKEIAGKLWDGIPRWALVLFAGLGLLKLTELHSQIKTDHDRISKAEIITAANADALQKTVEIVTEQGRAISRQGSEIQELRNISRQLADIAERERRK